MNDVILSAQSAAVRFGGLGRRYVLVVFDDRPAGLPHSPESPEQVYAF